MIHHSRNTSSKQWNETLVITFNGLVRVFKGYFHLIVYAFYRGVTHFEQTVESIRVSLEEAAGRVWQEHYVEQH